MKKAKFSTKFINKLLVTTIGLILCLLVKAGEKSPPGQAIVFSRAKSLDNGVSISWLEQTWVKNNLDRTVIKAADFELLKRLGFKCIRIPVAFAYYGSDSGSMQKILKHIDTILKLCKLYGFKLIICYHSGNLNDNNYLTETPKVIDLWKMLSRKYITKSADNLFFELYNEPPHMNPEIWKNAAGDIIAAVRKIDRNRTLIVGASNFNSIYELSRTTPLSDGNVIYTFHFYEPFFFTHQGAAWIGDQVSTTGVPFPYEPGSFPPLNPRAKGTPGEANYNKYNLDGNERSVRDKLQIVKNWALRYHLPVLCGEYGAYNKYAAQDSRCRYIKAVRQTLKALDIPGILWDYNSSFSIFNGPPAINHLPDCMKDAIGYPVKN